jgi:hypothetical protein
MTMQEIKKINILSSANIAGLIYALFAFAATFASLVYSLAVLVMHKQTNDKVYLFLATNLGLDFLIGLTAALLAGAIGWLIGLIAAWFYNFLAKSIGGIKIEIADEAGQAVAFKPEEKKQELFKY